MLLGSWSLLPWGRPDDTSQDLQWVTQAAAGGVVSPATQGTAAGLWGQGQGPAAEGPPGLASCP